jgi:2-polyprenyl-6-methoxyphenol hydroxylase-like FAD-dependent oxidoreductase
VSRIVVLGGGVCGLSCALMLSRDGHDVTVLERDPAPVPDAPLGAWDAWDRGGVTQFRQPHFLQPRGRVVLDESLPDVSAALVDAGATRFDPLTLLPPPITDREPRSGDERFVTVTARRPVLEYVLARTALDEPGLDIRRGVGAGELIVTAENGAPAQVAGVRTNAGEELLADLVVDAMGRRSPIPKWLEAAGAGAPREEVEDAGFIYYTRYFRGEPPQVRAPLIVPFGSISVLTLPGDNGTWSMTIYVAAGDQPLKRIREADAWMAVARALPTHAHWLEGEPITEVLAMGGVLDRLRGLVVDGSPVATGLALLGDACACTNPSLGRGVTLGLLQASCLRDVAREHLADPFAFAEAYDAATEAQIVPWYRAAVAEDRARLRQIEALRQGLAPPAPGDRAATVFAALPAAAVQDPDLFRAMLDTRCCNGSPTAVLEQPGIAERILELAAARPPVAPPGPDREQLLALLA